MKFVSFRLKFPAFIVILLFCGNLYSQGTFTVEKQKAFEAVFGDAVVLDSVIVEKVKNDTLGKRHYLDTDNDGKPDEVWFIDTDPRHNDRHRPILVRVIDENNNLEYGKEPDKHGDLWVADWNADGLVDAVIGYEDTDEDGDVDHMGMYFVDQINGLRAWWLIDDGDDNLLGYDVDYIYYQIPCQSHTHFGGNESLISMYFDREKKQWVPFWENPFLFYDSDNDGVTEEVVRIEGEGDIMRFLRWSFNVNPIKGEFRNFDVGITACAPGWNEKSGRESAFTLRLGEDQTESFKLRGFPTGQVVKRSAARENLKSIQWARVLMTWDENDLNTAWDRPGDKIERWEGIISVGVKEPGYHMPQVGGPDCGPFNKRYELVLHPAGANEFYFNPADHRIHIKNSNRMWINVDYNGDLQTDMVYTWKDIDSDGVMDRVEIDLDGDRQTDDWYDLDITGIWDVGWNFNDLNNARAPVLREEPERKYYLIQSLFSVMKNSTIAYEKDSVWVFIENKFQGQGYSNELAIRLLTSDESILYYLTLVQDRAIFNLKKDGEENTNFWKRFNVARGKGDTLEMARLVNEFFNTDNPPEDYDKWIQRLRKEEDRPMVAWSNDWLPPNWGWESEQAAFRFYDGHFDLFGKRMDTLIYPNIKEGKSYHLDQNKWGMDILHVGASSGIGGLTLYVNGQAFPIRSTAKEGNNMDFSGKIIEESHEKVLLEFAIENVGDPSNPHTVKIRPAAMAGRSDSPIEVVVEGGDYNDKIELGIGLTRLPEEDFFFDKDAGVMGSWGFQEPEIGWIGMGILFPVNKFIKMVSLPNEHQVIINCELNNPVHYSIAGTWLRGHQFPCCPVADDWAETLKSYPKPDKSKEEPL